MDLLTSLVDYAVAAVEVALIAFLMCGACLALRCRGLFEEARRRGGKALRALSDE
jgi:hypothetical protein